jgi:glutamyl-Q tRNA(Asp) synthetase
VANGHWFLRIEDIDPPREQPGADQSIISTLDAFGFQWDGPVRYQSANEERHRSLVDQLLRDGRAYRCSCSRQDLAGARRGPLGAIYPGTCRKGHSGSHTSIRVRTDQQPIAFHDRLQGLQSQILEHFSGDYIVQRRGGLIAYHLAVVADDCDQSISEVVRGVDLLDSTPRQIQLQKLLGFGTPRYMHIPVVEGIDGQKLSKQTGAPGLRIDKATSVLTSALTVLGQNPPPDLAESRLTDIWRWAIQHWTIDTLAGKRAIPLVDYPMAADQNGLS